jgi:hypothetical protein
MSEEKDDQPRSRERAANWLKTKLRNRLKKSDRVVWDVIIALFVAVIVFVAAVILTAWASGHKWFTATDGLAATYGLLFFLGSGVLAFVALELAIKLDAVEDEVDATQGSLVNLQLQEKITCLQMHSAHLQSSHPAGDRVFALLGDARSAIPVANMADSHNDSLPRAEEHPLTDLHHDFLNELNLAVQTLESSLARGPDELPLEPPALMPEQLRSVARLSERLAADLLRAADQPYGANNGVTPASDPCTEAIAEPSLPEIKKMADCAELRIAIAQNLHAVTSLACKKVAPAS